MKYSKKKRNLAVVISVIVLAVVIGIYFYTQKPAVTPRTYPYTSNFTHYGIQELKEGNLSPGIYNTAGYVVKIYTCPSCPPGAYCEPCMGDNIVISENNKMIIESYSDITEKELFIFAENPQQFELGRYYSFSIRISDYSSTSAPISGIELIGYNP